MGAVQQVMLAQKIAAAGGSPAFVQAAKGRDPGSTPAVISITPTQGNLLCVFMADYNGAISAATISDDQSGTWTAVPNCALDGGGSVTTHGIMWYQKNCAAGITAITCTSEHIITVAICFELSGCSTSAPLTAGESNSLINTDNNALAATPSISSGTTNSIACAFLTNTKSSGTATFTLNKTGTVGTYTASLGETDCGSYIPVASAYQVLSATGSQEHVWGTDNVTHQLVFLAIFH